MTDKTELRKLIDDVNEIEKVAAEMKAARELARRARPGSGLSGLITASRGGGSNVHLDEDP